MAARDGLLSMNSFLFFCELLASPLLLDTQESNAASDWDGLQSNDFYDDLGESAPTLNMILAHALTNQDMQTLKDTVRKLRQLDQGDPIVGRALSLLDDTDYKGALRANGEFGRAPSIVKLSVTSTMRLIINDAIAFAISEARKAVCFDLIAYSKKVGIQLSLTKADVTVLAISEQSGILEDLIKANIILQVPTTRVDNYRAFGSGQPANSL